MPRRPETILANDPLLQRVWRQLGRPSACRVVGGFVRDRLLGRTSRDLDLAIEASAKDAERPARRLAKSLGVRAHLLGSAPHRVWRVESVELKIELWPTDELALEDDVRRRDYTINALSWTMPDGPLVDLTGGLDDLRQRRLRAVSKANLEHDPVRLIRAPRFLSQLPRFELEGESRMWIEEASPRLAGAPRERVGQELLAMLRSPHPARGLRECLDLGLLEPSAPPGGSPDLRWFARHVDAADRLANDRIAGDAARLALLFRAWGTPTARQLAPYSWPKSDRDLALRAAGMLDDALETVDASAADRREFAWRSGAAFPAVLALGSAIEPARPGWLRWRRQWRRNRTSLANPAPLLSAVRIAKLLEIEPGPELGTAVDALVRAQVRGEVCSPRSATRWLRQRMGERARDHE